MNFLSAFALRSKLFKPIVPFKGTTYLAFRNYKSNPYKEFHKFTKLQHLPPWTPDEIHYYVTEDPPLGWTVPPEQNLDTSPEDFDDVIEEIQRLEAEEGETIYDEKYAKELELEDDLEDLRDQETSYEYPEY